ncbi:MAG: glycosyltransferase family 2 protein [Rhodanobacteraceae bacterium]
MRSVPGLASVIVVAADSGPLLGDCVNQVLASSALVELILMDNASTDGWPQRTAAAHAGDARFRLFRNGANLGFGPACNLGAARAGGDILVFLNPDCLIEAETIAGLRRIIEEDTSLAVVGITLCDVDGHPARGNRRREPTLRRAFMTISGLARLEPRWPAFAGVEMLSARVPDASIEIVEAVSGACLCLPREAFERLCGFDQAYFLHCEDLDLCRRARDSGARVAIAGALRARHVQGSSSGAHPIFVARHKHRGMWRYFRKFDPAARNPLLRALVWCGIWSHFVLSASCLALRRVGMERR